jgi:hypothetical protein
MPAKFRTLAAVVFAACVLALAGCATRPVTAPEPAPRPDAQAVLPSLKLDPALEDRILALDPERIGEEDVKTLAAGPTPQIVMLHGGIYPVHLVMVSFGRFLVGMGYPESKIRNPGDGRWSHSPYENSAQLAGLVAYYYERDGLPPMLIGHSQGGIQAVKVLRELDGQFSDRVPVWDPVADAPLDRATIVDPLTGRERPVLGLQVKYVSVVAAGGAAMLLPNQWNMWGHLRSVPNTVEEFTGYSLEFDLWAWNVGAPAEYRHNGTAKVRNVALPAWYNHVTFPVTHDLVDDPAVRKWISAYAPDHYQTPVPLESSGRAVLWAADVWYGVKKYWCLEAQELIRARRAAPGGAPVEDPARRATPGGAPG